MMNLCTRRSNPSPMAPRAAPSLFERLAIAEEKGVVARAADRNAAIASIIRNLHINLNSHAGSVPTRPDWGLSDLHDLALRMDQAAPVLAGEIKRQVEAFEPRLRRVRVRYRPERELFMIASFDIHAELVFADESLPVSLETRIHPNGAVMVN